LFVPELASTDLPAIEAFLYDSVLEVDAVCRTMEARSYNAASVTKDGSETERRVFLAGRGELLKIAILQVSIFGACVSIWLIRAEDPFIDLHRWTE
jgi:hypothetical protein